MWEKKKTKVIEEQILEVLHGFRIMKILKIDSPENA